MNQETNDIIVRFKKLFQGNPSAYGQYNHITKKCKTITEQPTFQNYEDHLLGSNQNLGIIPVRDHEVSCFGVLDFDNHKTIDGVNLIKLEATIRKIGAPLVVCRSKSGGAHVYLFGKKPLNTKLLKQTLSNYAETLTGFGELEIEIFPKQDMVDRNITGNWINLPYSNYERTERYAVIGGKRASIKEFLAYAESMAIDNQTMLELGAETHKDAPPCIEKMLKEKLPEGNRNNALYNYCIYVKKAFPENWNNLVYTFNAEHFSSPLKHDEVTKVINSVDKKDTYYYKCQEEPCKSRCNSSVCVIRKFGITPTERNQLMLSELPQMGKLKKYITDPIVYELEIEGKKLKLSAKELLNFQAFKIVLFEQLDRVIKPIKAEVWMDIVDGLIKNVEHVEVPDDASQNGIIRSLLLNYLGNANLQESGKEIEKRRVIYNGHPCVQLMSDRNNVSLKRRFVLFKSESFRKFLQQQRLGNVTGSNIFFAIKVLGVQNFTIRIKERTIKVWGLPLLGDTDQFDIYDKQTNESTGKTKIFKKKSKQEEAIKIKNDINYWIEDNDDDMDVFKPEF